MNDTSLLEPAQRRLAALMDRAIDTLEALLDDPALPAERRADLALRLLDIANAGEDKAPSSAPTLLPPHYFAIPDFLSSDLHAAAVAKAEECRDRFVASSVTSNEPGYRKSRVVFEDALGSLCAPVQQEILGVLPAVCTALVRPMFVPRRVELHMTVHGDGDFFKVHTDSATQEIETREISFVYYFMLRQPYGFSGGDLRLYETLNFAPPRHEPSRFQDITPVDNMIVFFESRLMHEVLPLHVASGRFEDARFTLNGWLHR